MLAAEKREDWRGLLAAVWGLEEQERNTSQWDQGAWSGRREEKR
jgi:hypothetical protein